MGGDTRVFDSRAASADPRAEPRFSGAEAVVPAIAVAQDSKANTATTPALTTRPSALTLWAAPPSRDREAPGIRALIISTPRNQRARPCPAWASQGRRRARRSLPRRAG